MFWLLGLLWVLPGATSLKERPTYSGCTVPDGYEKQLNIIPPLRDRKTQHGQTITVMCRTSGYTFMNHMYSVSAGHLRIST